MNILSFIQTVVSAVAVPADTTAELAVSHRLQAVVSALHKHGIKCNYDNPSKQKETRVLLYTSRYNYRDRALASECNGLILDYSDWSVVCYPPEVANANFDANRVARNFDKYRVFKTQNGTVVNLSYQRGQWRISTARGIDVTDLKFSGHETTYAAALDAAMEAVGIVRGDLVPGTTYSFGISHPEVHFAAQVGMWFVSSWSEADGRKFATELPLDNGECDTCTDFTSLRERVSKSFDLADPVWGVVLRSTDPAATKSDSTIFIESRLMNQVRTLVYDRHLDEAAAELGMPKSEYVFCAAVLDPVVFDNYARLFPDREAKLYDALRSLGEVAKKITEPVQAGESAVVNYFRAHIASARKISNMTHESVRSTIRARDYISIWHQYFYPTVTDDAEQLDALSQPLVD